MSEAAGWRLSATRKARGTAVFWVHNDDFEGAVPRSRRLSFVLHLSTDGWTEARCGGDFVWCAPAQAVAPEFNQLLLFAVGAHSWHHVGPLWTAATLDARADAACAAEARLAWAGWLVQDSRGALDDWRFKARVSGRAALSGTSGLGILDVDGEGPRQECAHQ